MAQTKLELVVSFLGGAAASGLSMLRQNVHQLKADLDGVKLKQQIGADLLALKAKFNEVAKSGQYSKEAALAVSKQIAELSKRARDAGMNVVQLHRELASLRATETGINLQLRGQNLREAGAATRAEARGKVVDAVATGYALYKPLDVAARYEDVVKDIAITGDMTRREEAELAKSIRGLAVRFNQEQNNVAEAMKRLVETGMSREAAQAMMPLMAKTATATRTDSGDAARMGRSFELLGVKDMELAFNQAAKAGKLGSFELRDMAKWFPALGGFMKELGIKGNEAVVSMAARMQVATRTAGSNDEAANNFKNFLTKLTSQDTIKDFKKHGVDLIPRLQAAARQGMDPIAAGVELVMQHVAKKAPEAAAELKRVAQEVAAIKDPAERAAELERRQAMIQKLGDRAGIGDLFQDMQAVSYLLAELQNKGDLGKMMGDVKSGRNADGKGVIDADFDRRTEGMAEKMKGLKIAMTDLGIAFGNALMPVADMLIPIARGMAQLITGFTETFPTLSRMGAVALTGASAMTILGFASKFLLGGLMSSAGSLMALAGFLLRTRLGVMATIAVKQGLIALMPRLAAALGVAKVALLSLGRALFLNPIGLAVMAIAGAAYLIYRNWEPISAWFGKVWRNVKMTFGGAWEWFKGLPATFAKLGSDLISGLVGGITAKLGAARDAIVGMGQNIKGWFAETLGIRSPSRVFMGFGANIGEGAQLGMLGKLSAVKSAASQLAGVAAATTLLATGGGAHATTDKTASALSNAGVTISFSPTIHVGAGGGDVRSQVNEAMQLSMRELEQMLRRLQAEQQRRAF